ncbi:hypothetical protein Taro_018623 [Colocasia esculenta]|uniref:Uncharacterized protein n=1 Tax=Colocasia esculenta TaxID=4460 RepID=A0A843URI4_COLES|nr:hypothetical protein [Colocasia esculenta]
MASRGRRGGAPAREDEPRREERAEPGTAGSCTSPTAACVLWSVHVRSGASHADAGPHPGCTPGSIGGSGLVGDPTSLEETLESDSERGE